MGTEIIASKSSPANLLGYTVINYNETLGVILEVIEHTHQLLCRLIINEKEVFIPLQQETLVKVTHTQKKVYTELPDGLLDVYLT